MRSEERSHHGLFVLIHAAVLIMYFPSFAGSIEEVTVPSGVQFSVMGHSQFTGGRGHEK